MSSIDQNALYGWVGHWNSEHTPAYYVTSTWLTSPHLFGMDNPLYAPCDDKLENHAASYTLNTLIPSGCGCPQFSNREVDNRTYA